MEKEQSSTSQPEEKEPIYYKRGTLSLIANLATWFSWIILVAFLIDAAAQFASIRAQLATSGMGFSLDLFKEPGAVSYFITNLSTPIFSGLGFFVLLQAAAIGLNVLLELDFNSRPNAE